MQDVGNRRALKEGLGPGHEQDTQQSCWSQNNLHCGRGPGAPPEWCPWAFIIPMVVLMVKNCIRDRPSPLPQTEAAIPYIGIPLVPPQTALDAT